MKPLGSYKNGNYTVTIFDDGTKVRKNDEDFFAPQKPESIDIKITNYCDMGCPMCHENSTDYGKHAKLFDIPFFDTLLPYTELAIGGGNPLSHPQFLGFLSHCKNRNLIANVTVNQKHFVENFEMLKVLTQNKYIHGLGVSVTKVDLNLLVLLHSIPNAVVHVINGVIPMNELKRMYNENLKLLILGYKDFRRGVNAHTSGTDRRMKELYDELPNMLDKFNVVSFDNLAIKQLDVHRLMSDAEWGKFYMGDDGQFTMYIDLVEREFAKSSVSRERYPLLDDIEEMFFAVREIK